jgi:hypothetical protein
MATLVEKSANKAMLGTAMSDFGGSLEFGARRSVFPSVRLGEYFHINFV